MLKKCKRNRLEIICSSRHSNQKRDRKDRTDRIRIEYGLNRIEWNRIQIEQNRIEWNRIEYNRIEWNKMKIQ